jgi:hypothetical protein
MTRPPRELGAYPLQRPRGIDSNHGHKAFGRLCSCGVWQYGPESLEPCTHKAPEPAAVSRPEHTRRPDPLPERPDARTQPHRRPRGR